jgi:TPR repeat protein
MGGKRTFHHVADTVQVMVERVSLQSDEALAAQAMEAGAYDEAVRLLRPLAERNSAYAHLALGWIYEVGATGSPSEDAARSLYEQAAALGNATACLYLGRLLWRSGDESGAKAAYERGAELGNDEAKSELAQLADFVDDGLARKAMADGDYAEAVCLLRPLVERNPECAVALGWIYETGAAGTVDEAAARTFYERATAHGSVSAYFELGRFLQLHDEDARARAAFEVGAAQGHLPSMSRLGTMLIEGLGGPTDVEAGTAWIVKAAEGGHILARRKLLGAEARETKSLFKKVAIAVRIMALGIEGAREMSKDPNSDKVR